MSSLTSATKHIPALNLLRGLAAISVCFFHVLAGDTFNSIPWLKAIFFRGYLGLDLFFIISGFIIPYAMYQNAYSINKFPKFLLKRSIRIEPPYIISFLLIICMRVIHCYIHDADYIQNWNQLWLHFFYLNQYFGYESYNIVYWSLAIEFQFYLLIGLFFPLIINNRKVYAWAVLILFSLASWYIILQYNFYIFQYGFLFIAGVLLFLFKIKHTSFKTFCILFGTCLILIYFKNGPDVVITIALAAIAIVKIQKTWKLTDFFGKISFSLYLVHVEATGWFMLYTRDCITNDLLLRTLAILFAIAFATGFYYLFERPALQLSKKIKYRNNLNSGTLLTEEKPG